MPPHADVAQLVERQLPKLEVAGSKPVVRSFGGCRHSAFGHVASSRRPLLSRKSVLRIGSGCPDGRVDIVLPPSISKCKEATKKKERRENLRRSFGVRLR